MKCAQARTLAGLALFQILVLACAGPREQAAEVPETAEFPDEPFED